MRTVVRNSFARPSILAGRVALRAVMLGSREGCSWCGAVRGDADGGRAWLYRFHVEDDGSRGSGPIADGKLFCSRGCCESYTGQSFDEVRS